MLKSTRHLCQVQSYAESIAGWHNSMKAKFANLKLDSIQVLSKDQQRQVTGGGGAYYRCPRPPGWTGQGTDYPTLCWCSNYDHNRGVCLN